MDLGSPTCLAGCFSPSFTHADFACLCVDGVALVPMDLSLFWTPFFFQGTLFSRFRAKPKRTPKGAPPLWGAPNPTTYLHLSLPGLWSRLVLISGPGARCQGCCSVFV